MVCRCLHCSIIQYIRIFQIQVLFSYFLSRNICMVSPEWGPPRSCPPPPPPPTQLSPAQFCRYDWPPPSRVTVHTSHRSGRAPPPPPARYILCTSPAGRSRVEPSRAESSRAEQRRAEQSRADRVRLLCRESGLGYISGPTPPGQPTSAARAGEDIHTYIDE